MFNGLALEIKHYFEFIQNKKAVPFQEQLFYQVKIILLLRDLHLEHVSFAACSSPAV
jgi:hypothetical protein